MIMNRKIENKVNEYFKTKSEKEIILEKLDELSELKKLIYQEEQKLLKQLKEQIRIEDLLEDL